MKRHRWGNSFPVRVGRARRISHCVRVEGPHPWCLCRKYTTRSGRLVGYLPKDRDIRQGLLKRAPRCSA